MLNSMDEDDLFVSTEDPVEVDDETRAAIERGRLDAAEGRLYTMEEVRERVAAWTTKYSSRNPR